MFFNIMNRFEMTELLSGNFRGTAIARIHIAGWGLSSLGYGLHLANQAIPYEVIEKAYHYAVNRPTF